MLKTTLPKVDQYVADVLDGVRPVCGSVIKTIQRHVRDLEAQKCDDYPYYFEPKAAQHIIDFYGNLHHWKGKWAGQRITLEPWQEFILASLFGWLKKEDKHRRFREGTVIVPRKNGKTTLAAGVGLYLMDYDNEPGAEVYSAATARDQAKILWKDAEEFIKASPLLNRMFKVTTGNSTISHPMNSSVFKPLSKDHGRLDGLNVHGGINDEIHAWKDRSLYDVIDTATGAREQPILLNITTAGVVHDGIASELLSMGEKILDGVIENERMFYINYTVDEKDEEHWDSPEVWAKANPNYGISVNPEDLEAKALKAQESEQKKADFLTKHLNIWVKGFGGFMNMQKWAACKNEQATIESSYGKPVYLAMDLASKKDLCAVYGLWMQDKKIVLNGYAYIPEEILKSKDARMRANFMAWHEQGYLKLTPGEITDYDIIKEDILAWSKQSNVISIAYDPFQATMMVSQLSGQGLKLIEVGQTVKNLSEPMKQLEAETLAGNIMHHNPVLSWAVSNLQVRRDAKENYFPGKRDEINRIDPAVACIMNFAQHLITPINKFGAKRKLRVWTT